MNPSEKPNKPSRIAFRGFGSMKKDKHLEIASKGGKKISSDKEHMREIGRMGGYKSAANRRKQNENVDNNQPTQL
jgi:hypothetical protein